MVFVIKDYDDCSIDRITVDTYQNHYNHSVRIATYLTSKDDGYEPLIVRMPKLDLNIDFSVISNYMYLDLCPFLEQTKKFYNFIKRIDIKLEKFIKKKFGENYKFNRSCRKQKDNKKHPCMNLNIPLKTEDLGVFDTDGNTIDRNNINRNHTVVCMIRLRHIWVNTRSCIAGCNWELIQIKNVGIIANKFFFDDEPKQTFEPSIVMKSRECMMSMTIPQPITQYVKKEVVQKTTQKALSLIPTLQDILSVKKGLKKTCIKKSDNKPVRPLRSFPNPEELSRQFELIKNK